MNTTGSTPFPLCVSVVAVLCGLTAPVFGSEALPAGRRGFLSGTRSDGPLPFDTAHLMEGLGKVVGAAKHEQYFCYRGFKVESWWEYAEDGSQTVEWESPILPSPGTPKHHAGKPVTFAVACGLARGGSDRAAHELYVGGEKLVEFGGPNRTDASWTVLKPTESLPKGGLVTLFFDYAITDEWKDNFGIMYITLSPELVPWGRAVRFKVRGKKTGVKSWFMLSGIRDNVAFVKKRFGGGKMEACYSSLSGNFVCCKEYGTVLGVFLTEVGGKTVRRLSYLFGEAVRPRFSPRGESILYNSGRGGRPGVWSMSRTGDERRRICDGDQGDWFPDGRRIALRRRGRIVERWIETGKETVISPPDWRSCSSPACSPDGRRILFVAKVRDNARDNYAIFVMTRGGGDRKRLAEVETPCAARWGPAGNRIAYRSGAHIWVMDADGGSRYQLTTGGGIQRCPTWSPDGAAIAYCQGPGWKGPWRIGVASIDGTRTIAVGKAGARSVLGPDWGREKPGERVAPGPVVHPQPRIRLWDTCRPLNRVPADWKAFLRERKGWNPVPVGKVLRGGCVVENESAVFFLSAGKAGIFLISKPVAPGVVQLVPLDRRGREAGRVESIRVTTYDRDEAVLESSSRSAGLPAAAGPGVKTSWKIGGSRALVQVTPAGNADKLRIRARMRCVVVPDRFGNDIVVAPRNGVTPLPSAPLVIGLLGPAGDMLALVCPAQGQTVDMRRGLRGGAGGEFFLSADVSFRKKCVSVGVITCDGYESGKGWHLERFDAHAKADRLTFDWQMPFPAAWRLAVLGNGKRYSTFFDEKESACFDGKKAFFRPSRASGSFSTSNDRSKDFAADVRLGLIYLYGRTADTPPEALTPVDLVRDALGLKAARRALDVEGLTGYRTATCSTSGRRTTWADLAGTIQSIRFLFERRLEVQHKAYVGHLSGDIPAFVEAMDRRLEEYAALAREPVHREMRALCTTLSRESPAAAEFLRALTATAKELGELGEKRLGLKGTGDVLPYCTRIRQLAAQASSDKKADNKRKFEDVRRELLAVIGPREEMLHAYRRLAKELRDTAGGAFLTQALSTHSDLIDLAEKTRTLCREVLRNRLYAEGDWRGERYDVPPFWLGPRPYQ